MKRNDMSCDDGVAAVELAILLPLFACLCICGVVFGMAYREQIMLRNAAGAAADYAAVQPCDTAGIELAAAQDVYGEDNQLGVDLDSSVASTPTPETQSLQPVVIDAGGDCTTTSTVTVTTQLSFDSFPGVGLLQAWAHLPTIWVRGQATAHVQGR